MPNPFRLPTARAQCTVTFACFAHPALFLPWNKMQPAMQAEFTEGGSVACGGFGQPGEWCAECRFGRELNRQNKP